MIRYVWEKAKWHWCYHLVSNQNCNRCLRLLIKTANNIKAHATWIKKEERVCMRIWECDIRFERNHKIAFGIPYLAITSIPKKCHKKKSRFQRIPGNLQIYPIYPIKYSKICDLLWIYWHRQHTLGFHGIFYCYEAVHKETLSTNQCVIHQQYELGLHFKQSLSTWHWRRVLLLQQIVLLKAIILNVYATLNMQRTHSHSHAHKLSWTFLYNNYYWRWCKIKMHSNKNDDRQGIIQNFTFNWTFEL